MSISSISLPRYLVPTPPPSLSLSFYLYLLFFFISYNNYFLLLFSCISQSIPVYSSFPIYLQIFSPSFWFLLFPFPLSLCLHLLISPSSSLCPLSLPLSVSRFLSPISNLNLCSFYVSLFLVVLSCCWSILPHHIPLFCWSLSIFSLYLLSLSFSLSLSLSLSLYVDLILSFLSL